MKVIIDTNVLVSAVLRGNVPGLVLEFIVSESECQWVASLEIIAEYLNVINRPKLKVPTAQIATWTDLITETVHVVEVITEVNFPRDQKDAMYLACAISSRANYLVTGDRDFEEVEGVGVTSIVTAREFKESVIDPWQSST